VSYIISFVIATLMTGISLAGLLYQRNSYPAEELRRSFVSNDVVNLFIGLPILLGSMWLTRRGQLIGLLFWPGALFYVIYNYIAYCIAMPFSFLFIPYLALVVLSVYAIIGLFSRMNLVVIQERLSRAVPERFGGGVLVGLGALFFLQGIGQVAGVLFGQAILSKPDLAVLIADLLITPAWIVGGVMLWKRQAFGYISGMGLLFQASMLFVGLLVFFILQPFLATVPFPLSDFVVIAGMGLVCFIPFALFVRAVLLRGK